MKRACKNCEWWEEGDPELGFCYHTDNLFGDGKDKISSECFCSNFFPPEPSCLECRWYVPDAEASMCYESPREEVTTSIGYCSRFQPNGEE